jgi:hypothetical protein
MFESFHSEIEIAGYKNRAVGTGISNTLKPHFCWAWKEPE